MESPMSRREIVVASLTAVGLASVALRRAHAGIEPTPFFDEQLNQVATLLDVAIRRMNQIHEKWLPIPNDGKPDVTAQLALIVGQCDDIQAIARAFYPDGRVP
jgi:hypothetical protein